MVFAFWSNIFIKIKKGEADTLSASPLFANIETITSNKTLNLFVGFEV